MTPFALDIGIIGAVLLAVAGWLSLIPAEMLLMAAKLGLAWAAGSTLLVAAAGGWVALRRGVRHRYSARR